MFIRMILKYYRVKRDRWKWQHRFYSDMYSEIYDELHKKNPDALHENIRQALQRTANILPKRNTYCPKHQAFLPINIYAFSPNHLTQYTHKVQRNRTTK